MCKILNALTLSLLHSQPLAVLGGVAFFRSYFIHFFLSPSHSFFLVFLLFARFASLWTLFINGQKERKHLLVAYSVLLTFMYSDRLTSHPSGIFNRMLLLGDNSTCCLFVSGLFILHSSYALLLYWDVTFSHYDEFAC